MHIGLIGGIGPAATDYYYREIIAYWATIGAPLELTTVHADAPTLLKNQSAGDEAAQVKIYQVLTERLRAAGAGSVSVTSIAGHFCIEAFKRVSPLPIIDMIVEVSRYLEKNGIERIGVLGTEAAMRSGLYGGIRSVEMVAPHGEDLAAVHNAYIEMAVSGSVTEKQRRVFVEAGQRMIERDGAEAILLGGTDLVLAFGDDSAPFETVDCARVHIDAIAREAAP